jgi:hypothetical protein
MGPLVASEPLLASGTSPGAGSGNPLAQALGRWGPPSVESARWLRLEPRWPLKRGRARPVQYPGQGAGETELSAIFGAPGMPAKPAGARRATQPVSAALALALLGPPRRVCVRAIPLPRKRQRASGAASLGQTKADSSGSLPPCSRIRLKVSIGPSSCGHCSGRSGSRSRQLAGPDWQRRRSLQPGAPSDALPVLAGGGYPRTRFLRGAPGPRPDLNGLCTDMGSKRPVLGGKSPAGIAGLCLGSAAHFPSRGEKPASPAGCATRALPGWAVDCEWIGDLGLAAFQALL